MNTQKFTLVEADLLEPGFGIAPGLLEEVREADIYDGVHVID